MDQKENKKKYEPPKVFRVVLNHDQAILAGCSTATTTTSGTGASCRTTCRRSSTSSQDSAANS